MILSVMSNFEAAAYVPKKPAAMMRIFNTDPKIVYSDIADPSLYEHIFEYVFDETDPDFYGVEVLCTRFKDHVFFDEAIADRIISDFKSLEGVEELVVHCNMGLNRSPAVAAAFDDRFSLGNDVKSRHPGYARHVYELLVRI